MHIALRSLTKVFRMLSLEVYWNCGKTKCVLQYRGCGASKRLDAGRIGPNGQAGMAVPRRKDVITAVGVYRHLGCQICHDGGLIADATAKVQSAMTACVPLAIKLFGSLKASHTLRVSFLWALNSVYLCGC